MTAKHIRGQDAFHVLEPMLINLVYSRQDIRSGMWITRNGLHVAKLPQHPLRHISDPGGPRKESM
ncbi:hypothetical protein A2U01_0077990 [Trifolium medium]|uniref:Uncharacterized protein n=1 Tax=Trifolium medium TaxID=97028 RepID=A0A392T6T3_9FABA|nr:hypothetical protein [Trifolium medium]